MARLTGKQIEQLQRTLLESFDRDGLKELLLFNLGLDLDQIVPPSHDLRAAILRIIAEVEGNGKTGDFLRAVTKERPPTQDLIERLLDQVATPAVLLPLELKPFEPETVAVPEGPFLMGADRGEGIPKHEMPRRPVTLLAYRIGKFPVTVRQYAEFIRRARTQPVPNDKWRLREPPKALLDHPVTDVSWGEAANYCQWLSREIDRTYRLPDEAEWEKAARGADGRPHPWGPDWDPACANAGTSGTTPVTAHPAGASPYGCEDMLGNAQEWTATLWEEPSGLGQDADRPSVFDPQDLPAQAWLVHKGGSYLSPPSELRCSARAGALHISKIPWRGFRVVLEVSSAKER